MLAMIIFQNPMKFSMLNPLKISKLNLATVKFISREASVGCAVVIPSIAL